jgi:hypothetical protein
MILLPDKPTLPTPRLPLVELRPCVLPIEGPLVAQVPGMAVVWTYEGKHPQLGAMPHAWFSRH